MSITEADEATYGDRLVALSNIRYQVIAGESLGVIDMYVDAALRLGAPRPDTWKYAWQVRDEIGGTITDAERQELMHQLVDHTYDYLHKRIEPAEYAYRLRMPASLIN